MEKLELYKYVESCIRTKFKFLYNYGYEVSINYNYMDRLSNYGDLEIIFENTNINRKLRVLYIYT
jgi:hypothetical protein